MKITPNTKCAEILTPTPSLYLIYMYPPYEKSYIFQTSITYGIKKATFTNTCVPECAILAFFEEVYETEKCQNVAVGFPYTLELEKIIT